MADMAGGAGDGHGVKERTRTKVCPRCGARLFEDMSVCYECLYDFDRVPQPLGLPTLDEPDGPLLDGVTASEPGAADRAFDRFLDSLSYMTYNGRYERCQIPPIHPNSGERTTAHRQSP